MSKQTPVSKYGQVIQKARIQENADDKTPEIPTIAASEKRDEVVNLSIKVSKKKRQFWTAEAKRQGTTITAVILAALNAKFGEPEA